MTERKIEEAVRYEYGDSDRKRLKELLEEAIAEDDRVYVVIDDDPTGGQTVHGVEVYTAWDEQSVLNGFESAERMFYIMTNSRGMTSADTLEAHTAIMKNIKSASMKTGRGFEVISRGDSTLRGHYPLEADIIAEAEGGAKHLLIPYFMQGDRYTVGDVHYLRQNGMLCPVGESEFSRDKTFGYRASNLKEWIEEKTLGKIPKENVGSVALEALRKLDFDAVEAVLRGTCSHIVVNAACDDDLRAFAVAYLRCVKTGTRFVARTAAGWPKIIGGINDAPLLSRKDMIAEDSKNGGLVFVGSHVKKTTEQLDELRREMPNLTYIQFDQHLALDAEALAGEVGRVSREAREAVLKGMNCVIYTRRERLDLKGTGEDELRVTRVISDAVTDVARKIGVKPGFILTKGGITSSDIAVKALGAKRAMIIGQAAPGVPVWRLGEGSAYPGMAYIIFPGNVGGVETLCDIVKKLCEGR